MSLLNAEIAKIALNCYITTKITFANSLAALCEQVKGADASVVAEALGWDRRIAPKYMRPGLGYGGPCFPRDNKAFAAFARSYNVYAKLARTVDEVNDDQLGRVVEKIKAYAAVRSGDDLTCRISILGLAYKPCTHIAENSQALGIARSLASEGYRVSVWDPQARDCARKELGDSVRYASSAGDCISNADIVVIAVPWEEFKTLNYRKLKKNAVILDCWQLLRNRKGLNVRYLGVGV